MSSKTDHSPTPVKCAWACKNSSMDKPSYSSNELPSIIEGEESIVSSMSTTRGRPFSAPEDHSSHHRTRKPDVS